MSDFTLIILRWYHGGVLDLSSGESVCKGRKITKFLDVDVDKMSYFELRDYIRKLGYSTTCTFSIKPPNSGILVDVDNDMDIFEMMCSLENGDEVDVFVKHLVDEPIVVDPPKFLENGILENMEESDASFDNRPNFMVEEEVEGSDYFTEDSVKSEGELVGDDNDDEEYSSDVHEEVRKLRAEKRKFQRRKRKERVPADNEEVPVGEAGPDLGLHDTETG
ncbi:hypothetical protein FXO37_07285 [Capsicum annuum]|nr:hypothetical protein FXO37_07285 [Capsicum annuum]